MRYWILALLFLAVVYFWWDGTPSTSKMLTKDTSKGCKVCSASGGRVLAPLMEPEFNVREVVKNMILLEDHLFHDNRRCPDCVRKHCLTIEAYLDEAFSLDKEGVYTTVLESASTQFKPISEGILVCCNRGLEGGTCVALGQRLRVIRKQLMAVVN